MARGTLTFNARVKGDTEAKEFLRRAPDRLDHAMASATQDVIQLLGHRVDDAIRRTAGGVYWDVRREFQSTPHGGIGRVVTPPNRPHIISPKPPPMNPHGLLRFKIGGHWVSVREVNHPGANPVDWSRSVTGSEAVAEPFYISEVAQALSGAAPGGSRFG